MGLSIYEIDKAILGLIDEETGEILDGEAFDQLQMEREAKLENVACWIKNLVAEGAALRAEEVTLAERRRSVERKVERLKTYLTVALGGEKFQTAKCAVTFRKTSKVEVADAHSVATWCEDNGYGDLVAYAAPSVSKTDLSKLLKIGMEIPGAEIVEGVSMGVK